MQLAKKVSGLKPSLSDGCLEPARLKHSWRWVTHAGLTFELFCWKLTPYFGSRLEISVLQPTKL